MNGKYQLGIRLKLPQGANVFNFAYLPEKNTYKIIIADYYDRLKVFFQMTLAYYIKQTPDMQAHLLEL